MSDRDARAFLHYENAANREPAPSAPRRRLEGPFTRDVPVRFPAKSIEVAAQRARAEGITVSAWIRQAVDDATREPRERNSSSQTK